MSKSCDGKVCCHQLFYGDTNNRMVNWRNTVRSRNLESFSVHAPMKARNVACPLVIPSSCYLFCTLIARLQSLQRGHEERHFSTFLLLLSLSLSLYPFLVFLLFLSLSLSPFSPLPHSRALSFFCSSPSHRRWSFRTRGDTSRPWRTCSPRVTSILTHPRCKSTNAFCASGTHAIQRVLLRWVL